MAQRIIANSFVSGEISPELYGRHDLKAYFNGAASLENFIVRRTGGIRKRAGTEVLFTLDADASPDDGTLDNAFKLFPYFYSSDVFGLLVFRITTANVVQTKLIIRQSGASTISDWKNIDISTGIAATTDFDGLNCKQVGDTLFFTRLGFQSFICKITVSDNSTSFTMLDNAIAIPIPSPITAVGSGFSGGSDIVKEYALYGVKDGVVSKPATAVASGGTKTPWNSGAKITVTGSMDFSAHDYYILAKKSGMNYGKLSEIYPVEQTAGAQSTFVDSDLVFRSGDAAYSDNGQKLLTGDPDLKASSKPTLSVSKNCIALKATATLDAGTTTYRAVTPHYLVDFGASAQTYAFILCYPTCVRTDTMSPSLISMPHSAVITPFTYAADGSGSISIGSPISNNGNGVGQYTFLNIGLQSGLLRIGFIIEWSTTTPATFTPADCLFVNGIGLARWPNFLPSSGDAITSCPGELLEDPNADAIVSEPTVFGKYMIGGTDIIHATLWSNHGPSDVFCDTYSEFQESNAGTTFPMSISTASDFHAIGSLLSYVSFTVPEGQKTISSIMLHLGSSTVKWTDGTPVEMPPAEYVTANLHAGNSDSDPVVATFNIGTGFIKQQKLTFDYPDGVDATTAYYLKFSKAVRIRGISCSSINSALSFVDDNILPGAVTGQQDMLNVGDNNMDCAIFDVYEQRTVFASSRDLPFSLWFSVVGDLYNFYAFRPQADDDAFTVTIPAKKASKILHILASKELMLFTEDGVYVVDAEGGNGFSYRTVRMRKICNATASSAVAPIQTDGKTIFVGEDGRTVYELKYDLMADAITPSDKSVLSYHLTETAQIVKIAYQRFPDSVIWFLLDDGNLASMTYMPEHEVYAWSHHSMAATSKFQKIVDIVEVGSLVTGDGVETTSDILLVYHTFTTAGQTVKAAKTIVERLRPNICDDVLELGADNNECVDHLNDPESTDEAAVEATMTTLRPESPEINTQGVPKRVVDVCLRLRRSGAVSVKPFDPELSAITGGGATEDAVAGTLALFSGDLKIMPKGYINGDGQIQIASADSKPCEILSAVYVMDLP